jgi:malonyl-CoA O-methyltransferase
MLPRLRQLLRRFSGDRLETLSVLEAYARWAPEYPPEAHNALMRLEQKAVLSLLPDVTGKAVLDLGCGTGRYLKILRERGAAFVAGIDLSQDMLRPARVFGPIARADLQALPLRSRRFDVVTSGLVVGYLQSIASAVAEMSRVLAPGGTVIYSDFHPFAGVAGHQRSFSAGGKRFAIEYHVHLYGEHHAACRSAGLEIEEVREVLSESDSPFPAVIVIRARAGATTGC